MGYSLDLKETNRCPGCWRSRPEQPIYKLRLFSVYDCPDCHLRFIDPSLTADQQAAIYQNSSVLKDINPALENYYEHDVLAKGSRTYKDYKRALDEVEKVVSGRTMCELGCGAGHFLKMANQRGWEVTGLDSSEENTQFLRSLGVNAICADIFENNDLPKYDVVVLWDVIEHPQQPSLLIEKCKSLLNKSGVLLIATPCYPNLLSLLSGFFSKVTRGKVLSPLEKMYMIEHTMYFSPKTLSDFLKRNGMVTMKAWKTETDLSRYVFGVVTRFCLYVSFLVAKVFYLQNRVISISRQAS